MENKLISLVESLLAEKNSFCQSLNDNRYTNDEIEYIKNRNEYKFNDFLESGIKYHRLIKKIERNDKIVGFIEMGVCNYYYCQINKKDVNHYRCFYITKNGTYLDFTASIEYFDFIVSIL